MATRTLIGSLTAVVLFAGSVWAQRVRVPQGYGASDGGTNWSALNGGNTTASGVPSANLAPNIQPFDPYALATPPPSAPLLTAPGSRWPLAASPGVVPGGSPYVVGAPTFPPAGASVAPPAVSPSFPGAPSAIPPALPPGTAPPGTLPPGTLPPGMINPFAPGGMTELQRLFQDTGVRHTWVAGSGDGADVQIHEFEASTTAFFPNFLQSNGPLRVTPGVIFHFFDGPSPPVAADLPSRVYSAYLDAGWQPVVTDVLSGDVSVRVGVFSDFNAINTDSIRVLGTGVGVFQIAPETALKLGAAYIDRADLKLLPAVGILYQPNPQTRWDFFFPAPKLANYWTNIRNAEVWWYLAGEYGGGSWTIRRTRDPRKGVSERVDVNDIRAMLGVEWQNVRSWYGFVEVGYVFNRELFFVTAPNQVVELDDAFLIRGGISF